MADFPPHVQSREDLFAWFAPRIIACDKLADDWLKLASKSRDSENWEQVDRFRKMAADHRTERNAVADKHFPLS